MVSIHSVYQPVSERLAGWLARTISSKVTVSSNNPFGKNPFQQKPFRQKTASANSVVWGLVLEGLFLMICLSQALRFDFIVLYFSDVSQLVEKTIQQELSIWLLHSAQNCILPQFFAQGTLQKGRHMWFRTWQPAWLEDKHRSWWYKGRPEREAPAGPLKRTLEQSKANIVYGKEVKAEEHSGSSMDDIVAFACEGMPEDESVPERKRPRFVQCKEEPVEP